MLWFFPPGIYYLLTPEFSSLFSKFLSLCITTPVIRNYIHNFFFSLIMFCIFLEFIIWYCFKVFGHPGISQWQLLVVGFSPSFYGPQFPIALHFLWFFCWNVYILTSTHIPPHVIIVVVFFFFNDWTISVKGLFAKVCCLSCFSEDAAFEDIYTILLVLSLFSSLSHWVISLLSF